MRVLILHDEVAAGVRRDEADTLVQAGFVEEALRSLGHETSRQELGLNLAAGRAAIEKIRPDVVFNLVESVGREGRLIHLAPALLDAMGVPYTGAGTEAVFCTSGKLLAKRLLRSAGLATPEWRTLAELERGEATALVAGGGDGRGGAGGRWILKSVWEHASVGLDEDSVMEANDARALGAALRGRLGRLGGEGFAERYVEGREFNLALIAGKGGGAPRVLPAAEIVFEGYGAGKARVVGYRAKWEAGSYEYQHTPRRFEFSERDTTLVARLGEMALSCWELFGLRGYARVDFRVDETGRPWILEVNTNPCLSPDAGFAAALEWGGMSGGEAIGAILGDCELERRRR